MRSHLVKHRVQVHLVRQLIDDFASSPLIELFKKAFNDVSSSPPWQDVGCLARFQAEH